MNIYIFGSLESEMGQFWGHVKKVVEQAGIVIHVLDARMIEETLNLELVNVVKRRGTKLLYVVNKCDLVNVSALKGKLKELQPVVYVSSTDRLGTTILKKKILEMSRGEEVVVGIVGYPNVGKSSVINALSGRGAARTSSESGFTKGRQRIRVDNKIVVLDTPGVLPYREKDSTKHAMIGAVDYSKIKDCEYAALKLIEQRRGLICAHYGVDGEDSEEILEKIGRKLKRLRSGDEVDMDAAGRSVLKDWQTGKIFLE